MADELSKFYEELAATEAAGNEANGKGLSVSETLNKGANEEDSMAGFYAEIADVESKAKELMAVEASKPAVGTDESEHLPPPSRPPPKKTVITSAPAVKATISAPPIKVANVSSDNNETASLPEAGPSQPPPPNKSGTIAKPNIPPPPSGSGHQQTKDSAEENPTKKVGIIRKAAGSKWVDTKLSEWPDNDFRIFVGNLGSEVNDAQLSAAFSKYPSFQKARVVKNSRDNKSKGYGFVSLMDPKDGAQALRELHGQYIGNRPCQLKRCKDNRTVTDKKGRAQKRTITVKEAYEPQHRINKFQRRDR